MIFKAEETCGASQIRRSRGGGRVLAEQSSGRDSRKKMADKWARGISGSSRRAGLAVRQSKGEGSGARTACWAGLLAGSWEGSWAYVIGRSGAVLQRLGLAQEIGQRARIREGEERK